MKRTAHRDTTWLGACLAAALVLAACSTPTVAPAASATPVVLPATATLPPTATFTPLPAPTATATPPAPTEAPTADPRQLVPAGRVRAYPGPAHYAGDVLTIEILLESYVDSEGEDTVTLALDGGEALETTGRWQGNLLIVPLALDTSGLAGAHSLAISAQTGDLTFEETYAFEVQPAEARPAVEQGSAWLTRDLPCCTLHYITHSAAERDLDRLAELFQGAADEFASKTGAALDEQLQVYLIDRMWGNGAFGGNGELAVVYTDRYYGPAVGEAGFRTLALHEFTHASRVDQNETGYFLYNEGLAVYLAGGHYKPEPLPERSAALEALGYYRGSWPYPGHEAAYLSGAVNVAYVVETYGWDTLWDWVAAASGEAGFDPALLESITQDVFGVSQSEFEAGLAAWRQSHDPGSQVDDLRLTVELQALRRQYQDTYAPPPQFIFGRADETYALPEHLPALLREPAAAPHVAVELLIANGQAAIVAGEFAEAEAILTALEATLPTGTFDHPLAADYLAATAALSEQGYQVLGLDIGEAGATARVLQSWPAVEEIALTRVGDGWQVAEP